MVEESYQPRVVLKWMPVWIHEGCFPFEIESTDSASTVKFEVPPDSFTSPYVKGSNLTGLDRKELQAL